MNAIPGYASRPVLICVSLGLIFLVMTPMASLGEVSLGTRSEDGMDTDQDHCPTGPGPLLRDLQNTTYIPIDRYICFDADTVHFAYGGGEYTNDLDQYKSYYPDFTKLKVGQRYHSGQGYYTSYIEGWYESIVYMKFDLDGIVQNVPGFKEVVSVNLILSPSNDTDPQDVGVFRVTEEWDMSDMMGPVSRSAMPELDRTTTWDNCTPSTPGELYFWDVTELFNQWVNGTYEKNGMALAYTNPRPHDYTAVNPLDDHAYLDGVINSTGGEPLSPTLQIAYMMNEKPLAVVEEINPQNPVEGQTILLNGTGVDPDNDGISIYKWWTDQELLAEGPDAAHIKHSFFEGIHKINFAVRDNDPVTPRWSEKTTVNIIVEVSVAKAPVIEGLSCTFEGVEGNLFPEGSVLDFTMSEGSATAGLLGSISIIGKRHVVDRESMTDMGDGTYTYRWDTADMEPGDYSVDLTLMDQASGLSDSDGLTPGPDMKITLTDATPPRVALVNIEKIQNNMILPGEVVTVNVYEELGESGCTGTVAIVGEWKTGTGELKNRGSGLYTYMWDTSGWPAGAYSIDAFLGDLNGNVDPDGVNDVTPDLEVYIEDYIPPDVLSVLTQTEDGWLKVLVQVTGGETGLSGIAYVSGPDYYDLDLEDNGDGWYSARINTTDLKPGIYEVEVIMEDPTGNMDYDGLERSPDVQFSIESVNPVPYVISVSPQDQSLINQTAFELEVAFSEAIDPERVNGFSIQVWDSSGQPVDGQVTLISQNRISFEPNSEWIRGIAYTASVSAGVVDLEGLPLQDFYVWSFSISTPEPIVMVDSSPDDNVNIELGNSQEFIVNFTGTDQVTWTINGTSVEDSSVHDGGNRFVYQPDGSGYFKVEATAMNGDMERKTAWIVRVSLAGEEADEGDGETEDDGGTGTENNTSGGPNDKSINAALIVLALVLIILPLIMRKNKFDEDSGEEDIGSPGVSVRVKKTAKSDSSPSPSRSRPAKQDESGPYSAKERFSLEPPHYGPTPNPVKRSEYIHGQSADRTIMYQDEPIMDEWFTYEMQPRDRRYAMPETEEDVDPMQETSPMGRDGMEMTSVYTMEELPPGMEILKEDVGYDQHMEDDPFSLDDPGPTADDVPLSNSLSPDVPLEDQIADGPHHRETLPTDQQEPSSFGLDMIYEQPDGKVDPDAPYQQMPVLDVHCHGCGIVNQVADFGMRPMVVVCPDCGTKNLIEI